MFRVTLQKMFYALFLILGYLNFLLCFAFNFIKVVSSAGEIDGGMPW